jgi:DNA modification methylase
MSVEASSKMGVYASFLASKLQRHKPQGTGAKARLHESLFDFQRIITHWALKKGRAAIFADCGLGKTRMQLEWGRVVSENSGGRVLLLAPLAVESQTLAEAKAIGVSAQLSTCQADALSGITITNYEKLHKFDPRAFAGIILDESSILKSYDGAFRNLIIESFAKTPYKLACTATPAPNDYMELGNHCEFLGILNRAEMLSEFFVHDAAKTQDWRLKGHAEQEFWKWVCSWAVMVRKPGDIGCSDQGFELPELRIKNHVVQSDQLGIDTLFAMPASSLAERRMARRLSLPERLAKATQLINGSKESWIVWCDLNIESQALTEMISGAREITGSDSEADKIDGLTGFAEGRYHRLVTKPSIAGWGMNWQHCHNQLFFGLSDSYEQFYQAVRRCWRFGQKSPVNVHIVTSHLENAVIENIRRKEADHETMTKAMIEHMKTEMHQQLKNTDLVVDSADKPLQHEGKHWQLYRGDCVPACQLLKTNSIHYSIFSPPFASLYTYSAVKEDMGNCRTHSEFYDHFAFLITELYRVLMPGRLLSFHCANLATSKVNDGFIGIRDFRGELIRMFIEAGFIYHSEVVIWKDPVVAMQRTKALGLLHKQLKKDSCMSRQGIPDYLVTMRKPGENPERVSHTNESFPVSIWQRYASPIWMDINPSNTLQRDSAREEKDEKHIAPLQLEVIRRALQLWTNVGDLVLSPFAGIGSEGYEAIKLGRRFIGMELKRSYFQQAAANLRSAEQESESLL